MSNEKSPHTHHEHVVRGMAAAMGGFFMFTVSNILMIWRESRLGRISDARFRAEL
jgi:hypothetical protein